MRACILAMIMICLLAITSPLTADSIVSKKWRVIDGNTVDITIRLYLAGIDALESNQYCKNASGEDWACGLEATQRLKELLGVEISCELHGTGRYQRHIATCFSNGVDVAKVLVQEGLAVARVGGGYEADEALAKKQKRGMWSGEFLRPRDWRQRN